MTEDRGQKTDVFEFGIGNAECGIFEIALSPACRDIVTPYRDDGWSLLPYTFYLIPFIFQKPATGFIFG